MLKMKVAAGPTALQFGQATLMLGRILKDFRKAHCTFLCPMFTHNLRSKEEYETNHPDQLNEMQSNDEFYGATKGTSQLAPHIQWVFIPALKDANEESLESKTSALGQLLARTVQYKVSFNEKLVNCEIKQEKNIKSY